MRFRTEACGGVHFLMKSRPGDWPLGPLTQQPHRTSSWPRPPGCQKGEGGEEEVYVEDTDAREVPDCLMASRPNRDVG